MVGLQSKRDGRPDKERITDRLGFFLLILRLRIKSFHKPKNMKTRNRLLGVLLLFTICSALIFTSPYFVKCKKLYPDEWLDLNGIVDDPLDFTNILSLFPLVFLSGSSCYQVILSDQAIGNRH